MNGERAPRAPAVRRPPCAVAAGIERLGVLAARADVRGRAHRPRDDHRVACPGGTLAVHDKQLAKVLLDRGVVVMHVHRRIRGHDTGVALERCLHASRATWS